MQQVEGVVRDLVESGVETLTVALINSYVNGEHERQIGEIVERLYPGFPVTLSSRGAAGVPRVRAGADRLHELLRAPEGGGLRRPAAGAARRDRREGRRQHPALRRRADDDARGGAQPDLRRALGPVRRRRRRALRRHARPAIDDILTFDMGGTSTDVALCQNGQPTIGRETAIGHFRIKVPSVNVHTVGAGGGSIAHVPELTKALRVGPQSAGAEPGPAAYGKGGAEPTVTDANVVLGPPAAAAARRRDGARRRRGARGGADGRRRDGARLGRAGGRGDRRDRQREHGRRAAARLGAARPRPARVRARRLRRRRPAARERAREADGLVPGDRPAGAGPALRDRRPRRRLPRRVRADVHPPARRRERRRGRRRSSTGSAAARRRGSRARGSPRTPSGSLYSADMRYHRQGYEIPVALDPDEVRGDGLADLEERFNGLHEQLYGFRMPGTACEIVNLRAVGYGAVPKPELPVGEVGSPDASARGRRRARGRLRRASACRRRSTTARSSSPGAMLDGPGDRHRVRLDDGRPARLPAPRSTRNFNILITPND